MIIQVSENMNLNKKINVADMTLYIPYILHSLHDSSFTYHGVITPGSYFMTKITVQRLVSCVMLVSSLLHSHSHLTTHC
jgi:hypothetical protein